MDLLSRSDAVSWNVVRTLSCPLLTPRDFRSGVLVDLPLQEGRRLPPTGSVGSRGTAHGGELKRATPCLI